MLDIKQIEGGKVVISGRFDASQAATAESVLDALSGAPVLDLGGLEYISSLGLGVLVKTEKRLRGSGGGLTLVNVTPHIVDVFTYAGLHFIFKIEPAPPK